MPIKICNKSPFSGMFFGGNKDRKCKKNLKM